MIVPFERKSQERNLLERIPPQSPEAEEAIVAAILLDPGAIERVVGFLRPEHFYFCAMREIYRSALTLYRASKPVDLVSVLLKLRENGIEEKIGGSQTLTRLADSFFLSSANVDLYAELVINKAKERQLLQAVNEIMELIYAPGETQDKLDRAEQIIYEIRDRDGARGAEHISDICLRIFDRLSSGKSPGMLTGMLDYDQLTGGLFPGQLIVTIADNGMGKSFYAIAVAYEIALRYGPVLICSMEMTAEQTVERLQAKVSGVNSEAIRDANLNEESCVQIVKAIEHLNQLPIFVDETPCPTVDSIRSQVRRLRPKVVFVDYLQFMGTGSSAERVRELDLIGKQLKTLARELSLPVFLLSQINRDIKHRTDKRPTDHDIRGSGAIENHADRIQSLYRDERYNPNSPEAGVLEIAVLKNRHGKRGTVKVLFEPSVGWFKNMVGGGAL